MGNQQGQASSEKRRDDDDDMMRGRERKPIVRVARVSVMRMRTRTRDPVIRGQISK